MNYMFRKGGELGINFPGYTGAAPKRPILSHFSEHISYTYTCCFPQQTIQLGNNPSFPPHLQVCAYNCPASLNLQGPSNAAVASKELPSLTCT